MIKRILTVSLILFSLQTLASIGDNSDFRIISQSDYSERISDGKDVILMRYIVIPDMDKKYKNILEIKDEQAILAKFSFLLKRNKTSWIEKYTKNCDNSLEINNLIKGLYYFSKKQYSKAIDYLEKFNNDEFKFLKLLMIADCKYELLRDKRDYKSIIGYYQVAIDNTDKEQNKSIINNRIKYIKYR